MNNQTANTKISVVQKCVFTSTWDNPQGGLIYYHNVSFENGDSGLCGRTKQNPDDMKEGNEVEYSIPANNKIKFVRSTNSFSSNNQYKQTENKQSNNVQQYKGKPKATSDTFLGYAYAYAKDMVVAGKTKPKDIEDLKTIAEGIYNHIKQLLKEDN